MRFVYSENTNGVIYVYSENTVKHGYVKIKKDNVLCHPNECCSEEHTVTVNSEKLIYMTEYLAL
jgi:hypothetical protein